MAGFVVFNVSWKTKAFWFTWKFHYLLFFVALVTCLSAVKCNYMVKESHRYLLFIFSTWLGELSSMCHMIMIQSKAPLWDYWADPNDKVYICVFLGEVDWKPAVTGADMDVNGSASDTVYPNKNTGWDLHNLNSCEYFFLRENVWLTFVFTEITNWIVSHVDPVPGSPIRFWIFTTSIKAKWEDRCWIAWPVLVFSAFKMMRPELNVYYLVTGCSGLISSV